MSKAAHLVSRRGVVAGSVAGLGLLLAGREGVRAAEELVVFAAASLKEAMDEVAAGYFAATGSKALVSYAASSQLARQIAAGAPADIFISADLEWMDWLRKDGHILEATRQILLGNSLVLVSEAGAAAGPAVLEKGFDLTGFVGAGRLVIAEPSSVPAGRYAKQSLEALGLWGAVEKRLVFAANVRAALALVARGEAAYGIVYSTDAVAEPKVKVIGRFPEESHTPILYPVAKTRQGRGTADGFLNYLAQNSSRDIFERHGFRTLLKQV